MRTTIDAAGRVVIPKTIRDRLGLQPGIVEVVAAGAGVLVQPVAEPGVVERDGFLVIPSSATFLDDATVRDLRDADQA